jgi:hypothetical protein
VTDLDKELKDLSPEQVKEVRLEASRLLQQSERFLLIKLLLPPSLCGSLGVFMGSLAIDLVFQMKGFTMEAVSLLTLCGGVCGAFGGVIGFKRYNALLLPFISHARTNLDI